MKLAGAVMRNTRPYTFLIISAGAVRTGSFLVARETENLAYKLLKVISKYCYTQTHRACHFNAQLTRLPPVEMPNQDENRSVVNISCSVALTQILETNSTHIRYIVTREIF